MKCFIIALLLATTVITLPSFTAETKKTAPDVSYSSKTMGHRFELRCGFSSEQQARNAMQARMFMLILEGDFVWAPSVYFNNIDGEYSGGGWCYVINYTHLELP